MKTFKEVVIAHLISKGDCINEQDANYFIDMNDSWYKNTKEISKCYSEIVAKQALEDAANNAKNIEENYINETFEVKYDLLRQSLLNIEIKTP